MPSRLATDEPGGIENIRTPTIGPSSTLLTMTCAVAPNSVARAYSAKCAGAQPGKAGRPERKIRGAVAKPIQHMRRHHDVSRVGDQPRPRQRVRPECVQV